MLRAAGEAAAAFASENWPASSTTSTSSRSANSGRDQTQAVAPTTSTSPASMASKSGSLLPNGRAASEAQSPLKSVFWPIRTLTPRSAARSATSSSKWPITLWLLAVTPTFRPRPTSSTIAAAPR